MENENPVQELIEYRLAKLEEAVLKLSSLSEVVLRWDVKFQQNGGFMQCSLHQQRMEQIESKLNEVARVTAERTKAYILVEEHEEKVRIIQSEIAKFKSYVHKAIGGFVVLSLVIQLLGPFVTNEVKEMLHHNKTPIVEVQTPFPLKAP